MALTLLPALVHRLTNCDSCYIPSARFVKSHERKRDKEWISAFDRLSTNSAESTAFRAAPSPIKRCSNANAAPRSEEHTSELQSLMRISYAVFCLTKHK